MIYTIKKNKHYSSIIPKIVCNNYIKGTINFLNDVKYDVTNQGDTNKIIGINNENDLENRISNLLSKEADVKNLLYFNKQKNVKITISVEYSE